MPLARPAVMDDRKPKQTPGRGARGAGKGEDAPGDAPADLGETWDQPQPRYPAPERPRDRAEERPAKPKRKRSA